VLKPLDIQDAESMYRYRSHLAVSRYQSWRPKSKAEVEHFIEKIHQVDFDAVDTWYQLGIYVQTGEQLVGDLGIHFLPPDNVQTEIGFTVSPTFQRRGYAAEAVEALVTYLFQTLQKHRIVASVDPRNTASVAFLEKLAFRKEAHFRESLFLGGEWVDDLIYAVLCKEWKPGVP
jgi:RimJ/RimL family protein N-acetyltransferase